MKKITLLMLIVFTMSIQAQNKLLSKISQQFDGTKWLTYAGGNYEYDSNDNLSAETYLSYDNVYGKWTNSSKEYYTYNSNNKLTEYFYQTWNTTTNKFVNSYKDNYTYTNGNLVEMIYYEWVSFQWVVYGKTVINYNSNNLPDTYLWYEWDGTQWFIYSRDTITYNANNKIIADLEEEWKYSQWVNSYRTLYTYNSNNKMISYKSADWDEFKNIWVENGSKTEYDWDATGNKTRETEYYKFSDGSPNQYKNEYTYDSFYLMSSFAHPFKDKTGFDYIYEDVPYINKVLGYNSFDYDQSTSSYELSSRTTYNYNSSITLGTKVPEIANEKVNVYPNPTAHYLNIQNTSNNTIDKVIVTDMSGKTILQQNQNTTQVDVQNLATGMYLLQVSSGNKKWQTNFLKQ